MPQPGHIGHLTPTVLVLRMAHRIWIETKQEPGTAGIGNLLGCCLVSFHFLWTILSTSTVLSQKFEAINLANISMGATLGVTLQQEREEIEQGRSGQISLARRETNGFIKGETLIHRDVVLVLPSEGEKAKWKWKRRLT